MASETQREALTKRIAAAKAAQAEVAAAHVERDELAALEAAAVAEELAAREAPIIAELVGKHGAIGVGILVVATRLGSVVVTRPAAQLFRRFADTGSVQSADLERLVRKCVLYPDASGLDKILDEQPASLPRIADAVVTLGGASAEARAGK